MRGGDGVFGRLRNAGNGGFDLRLAHEHRVACELGPPKFFRQLKQGGVAFGADAADDLGHGGVDFRSRLRMAVQETNGLGKIGIGISQCAHEGKNVEAGRPRRQAVAQFWGASAWSGEGGSSIPFLSMPAAVSSRAAFSHRVAPAKSPTSRRCAP